MLPFCHDCTVRCFRRGCCRTWPCSSTGSAGILLYNNTILSETAVADGSNIHWRNNLMLGQNAAPAIFSVGTYTRYTSSDYNGFQPNHDADVAFE